MQYGWMVEFWCTAVICRQSQLLYATTIPLLIVLSVTAESRSQPQSQRWRRTRAVSNNIALSTLFFLKFAFVFSRHRRTLSISANYFVWWLRDNERARANSTIQKRVSIFSTKCSSSELRKDLLVAPGLPTFVVCSFCYMQNTCAAFQKLYTT